MIVSDSASSFRNHLPNCKETAKRKKQLQIKASRDKNKSQRMNNITPNRFILSRSKIAYEEWPVC
jgi:hypothetical protein